MDDNHRQAGAWRAGAGPGDAVAHALRIRAVVRPQRAQALQAGQAQIGERLWIDDAHAGARRNAAAVGPPRGALGIGHRARLHVRTQRRIAIPAGMGVMRVAAIGGGIAHRHRAPQVEAHADRTRPQRRIGPAGRAQLRQRVLLQRVRAGAGQQAARGQRRALRIQSRHRRNAQLRQRARHQQRGFGGVVVQATRTRAFGQHVGFAGHHRVQPRLAVFRRAQHCAAAVGDAHRDDAGVFKGERRLLRQLRIQRGQRELRGLLDVATPVGLRVVL